MTVRTLALLAAAVATPVLAQTAPRTSAASPAEVARRSADDLALMRAALKDVVARADSARSEKDVVKLNCVNERLTQMRAFLKVAEQAERAGTEADRRRDRSADVEFAKVDVARTRVETLRAEAEKCVGLVALAAEAQTRVEVEEPEALPEPGVEWGDGARPAPAPPPVVRPGPASIFQ